MARREEKPTDGTVSSDPRVRQFRAAVEQARTRKAQFDSISGMNRESLYLPADADDEYFEDLGMPGRPVVPGCSPTPCFHSFEITGYPHVT